MALVQVGALAIQTPVHAAGNAHSFSRADTSPIDYRAASFKAAMGCEDVEAHANAAAALESDLVQASGGVPEHCRINGVLGTGIGFQVNLPSAWNGRVYMFGNGGYAGEDAESPREQASRDLGLKNGFVTVRTDTGHLAVNEPLATFALDSVKLVNHGYRAVHETITFAKSLATQFYKEAPRFTYWDGCSTGGRQGVISAQRFPGDFNGIVAAAPTLDWSSIMVKGLWNRNALSGSALGIEKMGVVFKAVMEKCDKTDGIADALIDDPLRCDFDPERDVPRCREPESGDRCLIPAEIAALKKFYAGPPKGAGTPAWNAQAPGVEHPSTMVPFVLMHDGSPDVLTRFAESWMRYIGCGDPAYDPDTFDFARDPAGIRRADSIFNPSPDLARFRALRGKMITFWGWADAALNPQMGLAYYDEIIRRFGISESREFYRLFLIPGVAHCAGGYGPDEIDALTAVINWVEGGTVPIRLPARRVEDGTIRFNRSYCAYPAATKYRDSGDPEDPRNFTCIAHSSSRTRVALP
ncbi:MAG: tannase/feruloyl esterase family alpha/beta hydrolase [Gammaproteobacteria bacterium]|nr:tannase/feruloyl esterase family alpha/beta hydrolase [Gammaproteobacteria bacterium]